MLICFLFVEESTILTLPDKDVSENCLFINKYFNMCLPTIFKSYFTLSTNSQIYNTRWSILGFIVVPTG